MIIDNYLTKIKFIITIVVRGKLSHKKEITYYLKKVKESHQKNHWKTVIYRGDL